MHRSLLLTTLLSAALLTACGSSTDGRAPTPYRLDGVWGGVLNDQGVDFAAVAIDVTTTGGGSTGTVSGYGVLLDEDSEVYLNVTGTTRPGSVDLTLTDAYDDSIFVSANVEGQVLRGTWRYPSLAMSGSMRMAEEENIDLLAMRGTRGQGRLADMMPR
ncbi:MAG: hypothetical protein U5K81_16135 [Trueperaceae bacterium]|nr:hypothetical protein [Trueperaceae bacterium]